MQSYDGSVSASPRSLRKRFSGGFKSVAVSSEPPVSSCCRLVQNPLAGLSLHGPDLPSHCMKRTLSQLSGKTFQQILREACAS